jgi:hypothetical protein
MKVTILTNGTKSLEQIAEPQKSPLFTFTPYGSEGNATYKEPWATSGTTINDMLEVMQLTNSGAASGYAVSFKPGFLYAAAPNVPFRCDRIDTEPFGQSSSAATNQGGIQWPFLLLHAHFVISRADPYYNLFEESMDSSVEYRTTSNRTLWWDALHVTNPVERDESPGRLVQLRRWSYTIRGLPSLPTDLNTYNNTVNTVAMKSETYGETFPVGTVLYKAPHVTPTTGQAGEQRFDVTQEFHIRLEGSTTGTWNKAYRAGYVDLQTVYTGAGAEFKQYGEKNLNNLLLNKA